MCLQLKQLQTSFFLSWPNVSFISFPKIFHSFSLKFFFSPEKQKPSKSTESYITNNCVELRFFCNMFHFVLTVAWRSLVKAEEHPALRRGQVPNKKSLSCSYVESSTVIPNKHLQVADVGLLEALNENDRKNIWQLCILSVWVFFYT